MSNNLQAVIMTIIVIVMVAALAWINISLELPIIQKCIDAGYTKYECSDKAIRALAVTQEARQ